MPLDTHDPEAMSQEVQRAEEFRKKHTARTREIIDRYKGNWYREDYQGEATPENLVANYVTFMLPELSFTIPPITVKAMRPVSHKAIADFMTMGMRSWLGGNRSWVLDHRDVVRDLLMGFGCMKVGMEPRDSYNEVGQAYSDGGRLTPFACRVPPDHLILDPRCEAPQYARFLGDSYWRDLDSILENQERWNPDEPDAMEKLESWAESDGTSQDAMSSRERAVKFGPSGPRKRVMLVDLWVPETGELLTLAKSDSQTTSDVVLRREQYEGPKSGPYQVFGCYSVPGDPYPIGPLQFAMEQFEEMQSQINSVSEASANYKRFVIVDAAAVDAQNAVATAKNGSVVAIRGASGAGINQVEMGGAHSEQLTYVAALRERFDRVMGVSDAQRGVAAGKTATEAGIVEKNVDARTDWIRQCVVLGTNGVLEKVGWYLFYNPTVVLEVSHTDDVTGQTTEGLFLGGPQPGQDADWMSFNLDISSDALSRPDQAGDLAKAMQLFTLAPQAMQLLTQMPMLNVRWLLNQIGEAMDIENLADLLINQQVLLQMGQTAQQQAMFGGMGQPGQLPGNLNPQLQQFLAGQTNQQNNGWMQRGAGGFESSPVTMPAAQPLFNPAMAPFSGMGGLAPQKGGGTAGSTGPLAGMMGIGNRGVARPASKIRQMTQNRPRPQMQPAGS